MSVFRSQAVMMSLCKTCGRVASPAGAPPPAQHKQFRSLDVCEEPICPVELTSPVPVEAVEVWVTELCSRYHHDPHWLQYLREGRGLTRRVLDELKPLGKFCSKVSPRHEGAVLRYNHGSSSSFDAQILDQNGQVAETIEVTRACNGEQERIANEAQGLYGSVPLWSNIPYTGSRWNRKIAEPELVSHDTPQMVEDGLDLIREAVRKKDVPGKYDGVNLIVAFDDFRFVFEEELARLHECVEGIKSCFATIYYVGLEGRVYVPVPRKS